MVKKRVLCDHCRGSGAASSSDIHTCTSCNGQGIKVVRQQIFPGMFSQSQVSCNECGGRGKIIKHQCPHCKGAKVLDHTQRHTLDVSKGTPEAHEIVFEGEADESPDWEAGDIVIRVRSKKDKGGFRRKEHGLYWKETISVDEVSWFWTCSMALKGQVFKVAITGTARIRTEPHSSRWTHRPVEEADGHPTRYASCIYLHCPVLI